MTRATHENFSREDKVAPGSVRAFGVTMAVAIVLIALLNLWHDGKWWPWLLGLAALLLATTYLWPSLLRPLNQVWFKLGMLMHAVVSPIVMALLFFTGITATAVIMRIFGKNLLRLRRPQNAQSYWIPRQPPGPAPESMRDQF
jgi:hypothetical protein